MATSQLSGDGNSTNLVVEETASVDKNGKLAAHDNDMMDAESRLATSDGSEDGNESTISGDDELDLVPMVVSPDEAIDSKGTPESKIKHTPITPRGTVFKWADNMKYRSMAKEPFKLGVEDDSLRIIRLKATNGNYYEFKHKRQYNPIPPAEWNNPTWIKAANCWHVQIINRRLNKNRPDNNTLRATRAAWSVGEFDNAVRISKRYSRELNRKLQTSDFTQIAESYNRNVQGTVVRVGERLVTDETIVKKRPAKKVVTADSLTPQRNKGGLLGLINKWHPELLSKSDAKIKSNTTTNGKSSSKRKSSPSPPEAKSAKALKLTLDAGKFKSAPTNMDKSGDDDEHEEMGGLGGSNMSEATAGGSAA